MDAHTKVYVQELPDCDFCTQENMQNKRQVQKARYDARTSSGPWANMCPVHFSEHGIGLGLGKGQKLVLKRKNAQE